MASADKASSKAQAWFCTTGLPSDIVIEVGDTTFHLHKFPLMSKSRKLHLLITEQEETNFTTLQTTSEDEVCEADDEELQQELCHISLPEFPGGSDAFETAAKFCYGVKIELSSSNVAPLRCAAEFLEMADDYSEDNLISRTERFLSHSILESLKESINTLKSCEPLMPIAERLNIPQRCVDSIAVRASAADPSLFGWPVNDGDGDPFRAYSKQILWNGIDTGMRRKDAGKASGPDSWIEDLAHLSLPLFRHLISAMRSRDLSADIIESCVICYAGRYIPGITRSGRKSSSSASVASETEQRELLETIIKSLRPEKSSRSATATRFLFGLLRTANILTASEACRAALEKKIGSQLEHATLDDLLIPSYSYLNETLYDVNCVERILSYFLEVLEERSAAGIEGDEGARSSALMFVGKLIDGYLSEIASDANLKPEKFYELAVILPEHARLFDDGLYRAIDVYIKAHPWISEAEREKIYGVMDCQKLTLEACTHAAQNARLPLRAVVQVLFFEQLQLRHAIGGSLLAADLEPLRYSARTSVTRRGNEEDDSDDAAGEAPVGDDRGWRAAVRENHVLRLDMDSMRTRVQELERECSNLKKAIEKIDKVGPGGSGSRRGSSFTEKLGCKFKTQVRDSHEPTAAGGRKSQHHHHRKHDALV
ncbi:BTB/POZ domain-containing protein At5g66560-like isoform X2 [Malania oleifera]|uniref:BTB/POZ domain-containing protein At5g66560-like isoform X2 n=1 Tax=Malania oleifera TaxID=397392 RepID=UPI0025ADCF95|nr:BTB/POZ domain-containing protein At5g66560-like isoform X2 [Malania oleifera]